METNRSPREVFAIAVRSSSARKRSSLRVSTTSNPAARSRLARRRAIASVTSFSRTRRGPMAPGSWPPCPASTTMRRIGRAGRAPARARRARTTRAPPRRRGRAPRSRRARRLRSGPGLGDVRARGSRVPTSTMRRGRIVEPEELHAVVAGEIEHDADGLGVVLRRAHPVDLLARHRTRQRPPASDGGPQVEREPAREPVRGRELELLPAHPVRQVDGDARVVVVGPGPHLGDARPALPARLAERERRRGAPPVRSASAASRAGRAILGGLRVARRSRLGGPGAARRRVRRGALRAGGRRGAVVARLAPDRGRERAPRRASPSCRRGAARRGAPSRDPPRRPTSGRARSARAPPRGARRGRSLPLAAPIEPCDGALPVVPVAALLAIAHELAHAAFARRAVRSACARAAVRAGSRGARPGARAARRGARRRRPPGARARCGAAAAPRGAARARRRGRARRGP